MSEQQPIPTPNVMPPKRGSADSDTSKLSPEETWARDYLGTHVDLFDRSEEASDSIKSLLQARTDLAENSVRARRGGLTFDRRYREDTLAATERNYHEVWQSYLEEAQEALPKKTNLPRKRALIAELSAREDGALMGEEANFYLNKEHSWLKRNIVERYKGLSKKQRLAVNIGGAALAGVLSFGAVGLIGAGAAAGAVGGRVARVVDAGGRLRVAAVVDGLAALVTALARLFG
jgi:hypothetical protein